MRLTTWAFGALEGLRTQLTTTGVLCVVSLPLAVVYASWRGGIGSVGAILLLAVASCVALIRGLVRAVVARDTNRLTGAAGIVVVAAGLVGLSVMAAAAGRSLFLADVRARLPQYRLVAEPIIQRLTSLGTRPVTVMDPHPDIAFARGKRDDQGFRTVRLVFERGHGREIYFAPDGGLAQRVDGMCLESIGPRWYRYQAC